MNRAACLLVTLAFLVWTHECADLEPQIKLKRVKMHYVDPSYFNLDSFDVKIVPRNATYNNLSFHWERVRDLPADISTALKIYLADENGKKLRLLLQDNVPVCTESKNRELMMKVLVVPKSQLGGKCIKKGSQCLEDMGQVRFEHLIPNIENLGKYYVADYALMHGRKALVDGTFYSQWGYLQD